jgi:hypothetical protein
MDQLARIDKALDEALVNLGAIVLRLTDPAATNRRALARSVNQFSLCANRSGGRGQRRLLHPVDDRRPILFEHALAHEQPKMIARHQHVMKGFRRRSG